MHRILSVDLTFRRHRKIFETPSLTVIPHRALVTILCPAMKDPMDASYDSIVSLMFVGKWIGPCKTIAKHFSMLSEHYPSLQFYHVNIHENTAFCKNFAIHAAPTFVVVYKGKIQYRVSASALQGVKDTIDRLLEENRAKENPKGIR